MAESKKEQAFTLFDQGRRPSDPEVKELGIKADTLYRYFTYWKSQNPSRTKNDTPSSPSKVKTDELDSPSRTDDKKPSTFIKVVPKVTVMGYTPIMQRAQEAAINEMGWPVDMSLEDFLDTVLYHYFKRKGIRLEAYVIEESAKKEET